MEKYWVNCHNLGPRYGGRRLVTPDEISLVGVALDGEWMT